MERIFKVLVCDNVYDMIGNENTTLDDVWASCKCWYRPNMTVAIIDDKRNVKIFNKEETPNAQF